MNTTGCDPGGAAAASLSKNTILSGPSWQEKHHTSDPFAISSDEVIFPFRTSDHYLLLCYPAYPAALSTSVLQELSSAPFIRLSPSCLLSCSTDPVKPIISGILCSRTFCSRKQICPFHIKTTAPAGARSFQPQNTNLANSLIFPDFAKL